MTNTLGYLSTILRNGFYCWLLLCAYSSNAQMSDISYKFSSAFKFQIGDNPDWAKKEYDHSQWPVYDVNTPTHVDGILWLRLPIHIGIKNGVNNGKANAKSAKPNLFPQAIVITSLMSYELYLDGHFVMSNGVVAQEKSNEVRGLRQARTIIPKHLITDGEHVFALRISAHHLEKRNRYYEHMNLLLKSLLISNYTGGSQINHLGKFMVLLVSVVSLVLGCYFVVLWFNDRDKKAFGLLAGLCVCFAMVGILNDKQLIWLYNYPYDWDFYRWCITLLFGNPVIFLMPTAFLYLFDIEDKTRWFYWILATVVVCLVFSEPEFYGAWVLFSSLILSLLVHVDALRQKKDKALLSLFGLILCTFVSLIDYDYFFSAFIVLVILLLTRTAVLQRRQTELLAQTRLQAIQLEAELLRKNIQPHFILNSLTSLMEWVETEPEKSIDFIADLADEFRLFSEVASQSLIPASKEIDICKKHLSIMAFRLYGQFNLTSSGIVGDEQVPPAIFHSLIENAFSHNNYANLTVDFSLSRTVDSHNIRWCLAVPVSEMPHSDFKRIGAGFSTSYVESRLQQSFPDQWQVLTEQTNGQWITRILINKPLIQQSKKDKNL